MLWASLTSPKEYLDVNRTYSDVAQTISQNSNFSIRTDVYTYENGNSCLLLNIAGTLPVNFRGTTYMFPLSIWIPHEYPRATPFYFVTPTKNMAVRPGQHVSGEGRVYHPYLAGWREDRSNISEFLGILQEVFAREPPVVSRQGHTNQPAFPARSDGAPPPVPPLPSELGTRYSRPQMSSASEVQPPKLPPKPFASQGQSPAVTNEGPPPLPPHPGRAQKQYPLPQNNYHQEYAGSLPPLPTDTPQRASSLQSVYLPNDAKQQLPYLNNPEPRRDSYSPVSPLTPPRQGIESPPSSMQPSHRPYSFQGPPPPPRLPPTAAGHILLDQRWNGNQSPYTQQNVSTYQVSPNSRSQGLQQQQPPRPKPVEDLLTSPFDTPLPAASLNVAPPPIPPNPQKDALLSALSQTLTQQIHSTYASNFDAITTLQAQQSAMHTTLAAINRETSQLNNLQTLLSSNEAILHKAMRDADGVMEAAKHRKVPGVDEVLVAPTVVAGQLYELVADERSLEECRAVVGKALDRGRIGGDAWAKVR
ncbi:hypothetical protein MMC07_001247 [Pseudocyphellaria aurata]|nr:hypothetical protein [Pseudocyphellaria aurata]